MKFLKFLLSITVILAFNSCSKNDTPTPNNLPIRYKETLFTNVSTIIDIPYGSNISYAGSTTTLTLDFYYPEGDTATNRPLLILIPGGAFSAGMTDKRAYLIPEAEAIAKYGYAVACINYRTNDSANSTISNNELKQLILLGMQDTKAAIRFFRKDAATSNTYKINPSKIFIGGHSAGAFVALHTAYLDDINKADTTFQHIINTNGGLEGNSGNDGYSSLASGVINLSGALLDKNYITAGGIPLKSIYGTADDVIPSGDAILNTLPTIVPIPVSGATTIHSHARSVGVASSIYAIDGGDHLASSSPTCTTCLGAISGFMYNLL